MLSGQWHDRTKMEYAAKAVAPYQVIKIKVRLSISDDEIYFFALFLT